ncbi:MAG: hypothetical protein UU71_C0001G0026 [Parcubacteria group bacterium GW2011_GWB1_41_6]|nr:MAG: hypothetical protein UU71_C0001G0026 [Parcubacteria group bacterium GW2011_GWB1_41_6]KKS34517.1 MAG: hypothetical protein UU96_C0003G0026 [Parcubacteria group bacterium GW2011_GWC2_42_13]KKS57739.1 MAG: hypothetical protein UV22_C0014G0010 [Parcubacteria group bacterium GW2011_GWA2_42_35]
MEDNFKSDSKSFTKFKTVNIILSLSAVIWTMGWSFYTYNKFLPLSKADVILSESDIVIIQSNSCGALETKSCDIIQPIIRNVGKAIAKNISFKVYIFPIDNKVEFVKDNPTDKVFDDKIVNSLSPQEVISFGIIALPHEVKAIKKENGKQVDFSTIGIKNILVFYLEYVDSIGENIEEKYFFFNYITGRKGVSSLVGSDFQNNYLLLEKKFEYFNDEKLLRFLKDTKSRVSVI